MLSNADAKQDTTWYLSESGIIYEKNSTIGRNLTGTIVGNNPVNFVDEYGYFAVPVPTPTTTINLPSGISTPSTTGNLAGKENINFNKENNSDKWKPGSKNKRDNNYGYPRNSFKKFWKWYERLKKKYGLGDITSKKEADDYYNDYTSGGF